MAENLREEVLELEGCCPSSVTSELCDPGKETSLCSVTSAVTNVGMVLRVRWHNTCVGQMTDWGKCLQYRIYEELLQINKTKWTKNIKKKKGRGHEQHKSQKKNKWPVNTALSTASDLGWVGKWRGNYSHSLLIKIKFV